MAGKWSLSTALDVDGRADLVRLVPGLAFVSELLENDQVEARGHNPIIAWLSRYGQSYRAKRTHFAR